MQDIQFLSQQEIAKIQAKAHELRAAAINNAFKFVFARIAQLAKRLGNIRLRHA